MTRTLPGTAAPLPECLLCEAATRRDVHERNKGLCSRCAGDATVRIAPLRSVDDDTAYVERYRPPVPPVPGQLELSVTQEPACRWAHGPVAALDPRGLCRICADDEDDE